MSLDLLISLAAYFEIVAREVPISTRHRPLPSEINFYRNIAFSSARLKTNKVLNKNKRKKGAENKKTSWAVY